MAQGNKNLLSIWGYFPVSQKLERHPCHHQYCRLWIWTRS